MTDSSEKTAAPAWAQSLEYAGFFVRFVAAIIDTIVVMIPLSLIMSIIYVATLGERPMPDMSALENGQPLNPDIARDIMLAHLSNPEHISRWMTENIITTIVAATVTIVFWYMFSATPGKMMLGIKIVDAETGQPPSTKQDIVRYLGYFVSIIPMLFGFLWVFWDKRAQGWHDKMANTVVVYKRSLPVSLRELSRKTKAASGAADSNAA